MAPYQPAEPTQSHPLSLGFTMTLIAFAVHVLFAAVGAPQDHGLGYWALVSLIQWATFTLAGYGKPALYHFVAVPFLATYFSLWAALLPAAAIVLVRVLHRGASLRRTPVHGGLWPTLQAWTGWSRR
ncbi:hypothetical protein [Streptomyces sp. NPDC058751]|uniref:hypothetical protein n=1 Tax=Streptomyces sp. NPDC058751 TaxID=3346623 RepID=UPI0036B2553D